MIYVEELKDSFIVTLPYYNELYEQWFVIIYVKKWL